jgi:uncharacterized protein with HEPN domain
MGNDVKALLYDILNAIVEIESFFNNEPKVFAKYQNDLRTKQAIKPAKIRSVIPNSKSVDIRLNPKKNKRLF